MSHNEQHRPAQDTYAAGGARPRRSRRVSTEEAATSRAASSARPLESRDTLGAQEGIGFASVPQQLYPHDPSPRESTSGSLIPDQLYTPQRELTSGPSASAMMYINPYTQEVPRDWSAIPIQQYPCVHSTGVTTGDSNIHRDASQAQPGMGALLPEASSWPETLDQQGTGLQDLGTSNLTHGEAAQQTLGSKGQSLQDVMEVLTKCDPEVMRQILHSKSHRRESDAHHPPGGVFPASELTPQDPDPAGSSSAAATVEEESSLTPPRQTLRRSRKPKLYELGPLENPEDEKRRLKAKRQKELREKGKKEEQQLRATLQALAHQVKNLKLQKSRSLHRVQHLEAQLDWRNPGEAGLIPESRTEPISEEQHDDEEMKTEKGDEAGSDKKKYRKERK